MPSEIGSPRWWALMIIRDHRNVLAVRELYDEQPDLKAKLNKELAAFLDDGMGPKRAAFMLRFMK